jgi:hypothetical protein
MAFTEFCCRSGGSNLNAGTRTGGSTVPGIAASFTYASGSWVASTGVFTVASGDPSADGVAVGDFASVYADGASVTGFVGRVTARTSTTITVSLSARSGTAPTDGTSNRTLRIGGAWKGPNAAENFPFGFHQAVCSNAAGDRVRVNFMGDSDYNITATITHTTAGLFVVASGFTTTYGDGGRATIDGGTTGASYQLLTLGGGLVFTFLSDFKFCNNGATGSADGITTAAFMRNIVVCNVRGSGIVGACQYIYECEAYGCNQSNTTSKGGFSNGGTGGIIERCIAHDNTGSNTDGFFFNGGYTVMLRCIADSNGRRGATNSGSTHTSVAVIACDFYDNGSDGLNQSGGLSGVHIEDCNFLKNGGFGINFVNAPTIQVRIANCGFGSGTMANASGNVNNLANADNLNSVTYAANITPWVDPANGDFRINLAAAKGAGRGTFTQTAASYAGTVGYPDIGAAQSQASGSGGIPIARGMHGGMR